MKSKQQKRIEARERQARRAALTPLHQLQALYMRHADAAKETGRLLRQLEREKGR